MSTYSIKVANNSVLINTKAVSYKTDVATVGYSVSLSRTGSQGSRGSTITDVTQDPETGELLFYITDSAGITTVINAGPINSLTLNDLQDVEVSTIADGQTLLYQSGTYVPHTLTTTSISDIDNTNRAEGAVLVYDSLVSKYKATTKLENANTTILGGTF